MSREWRNLSASDYLWRTYYKSRFREMARAAEATRADDSERTGPWAWRSARAIAAQAQLRDRQRTRRGADDAPEAATVTTRLANAVRRRPSRAEAPPPAGNRRRVASAGDEPDGDGDAAPAAPRPRAVRAEESESEDEGAFAGVVPVVARGGALSPRGSYKARFKARLLDPRVGDAVEVAWRGKFRLESLEIYRGTAWWVAIVVDKVQLDGAGDRAPPGGAAAAAPAAPDGTAAGPRPGGGAGDLRRVHASQSWYKVTFPGWEGRWDEWVSRDRLRWAAPVDDDERKILLHDNVEVWCGSKNVPGAWLEASVQRVKDQEFFMIGKVLSTGSLWVERSRVRLARKSSPAPPPPRPGCARFAFGVLLRNSPLGKWRRLRGALARARGRRPAAPP